MSTQGEDGEDRFPIDEDWTESKEGQEPPRFPDPESGGDGEDKPFVPPDQRTGAPEDRDPMQMIPDDEELTKREKEFQDIFGAPEQEPIERRTSEAEKLYANLLMKTDFDRDFIEEMLEYEPDAESEERIEELRQKRREMEELMKNGGPPPMMGGGPPMGGGGMDMIVI